MHCDSSYALLLGCENQRRFAPTADRDHPGIVTAFPSEIAEVVDSAHSKSPTNLQDLFFAEAFKTLLSILLIVS
jgi:hypothetical protein